MKRCEIDCLLRRSAASVAPTFCHETNYTLLNSESLSRLLSINQTVSAPGTALLTTAFSRGQITTT